MKKKKSNLSVKQKSILTKVFDDLLNMSQEDFDKEIEKSKDSVFTKFLIEHKFIHR